MSDQTYRNKMHNIRTNFSKFYSICKALDKEVGGKKNFQFYPVTDYAFFFQNLIDRNLFNRRRRRLMPYMLQAQEHISNRLKNLSQTMVVDSIPVPVVKLARKKTFNAFKKSFDTGACKRVQFN